MQKKHETHSPFSFFLATKINHRYCSARTMKRRCTKGPRIKIRAYDFSQNASNIFAEQELLQKQTEPKIQSQVLDNYSILTEILATSSVPQTTQGVPRCMLEKTPQKTQCVPERKIIKLSQSSESLASKDAGAVPAKVQRSLQLVDKMKPKSFDQMIGVTNQVQSLRGWVKRRMNCTGEPICLLSGEPGTGKSTLAHLGAREHGLDVLEINASMDRCAAEVRKVIEQTCCFKALGSSHGKQMLLIEEIDGAYNSRDNIVHIVLDLTRYSQHTNFPIIVATCNNRFSAVLGPFMKNKGVLHITFPRLKHSDLSELIKRACTDFSEDRVSDIAASAQGDARQVLYRVEMQQLLKQDSPALEKQDIRLYTPLELTRAFIRGFEPRMRGMVRRQAERKAAASLLHINLAHNVKLQNVGEPDVRKLEAIADMYDATLQCEQLLEDQFYAECRQTSNYINPEISSELLCLSVEVHGPLLFENFGTATAPPISKFRTSVSDCKRGKIKFSDF